MPKGGTGESSSFSELTRSYFGRAMTVDEAFRLLESDEFAPSPNDLAGASEGTTSGSPRTPAADGARETGAAITVDPVWVGSAGYERHKLNDDFAEHLRRAGVERLVDVREMPISRRRGYAKTALSEALGRAGIEYLHLRALGNPKLFRDLYKSGQVEEGRRRYEKFLLDEGREALDELAGLLYKKRTALMCVEHDRALCHRAVILDALRDELGLDLRIIDVG